MLLIKGMIAEFSLRVQVLFMLAHCQSLLEHLNRTETSVMLLITPELFTPESKCLLGIKRLLIKVACHQEKEKHLHFYRKVKKYSSSYTDTKQFELNHEKF